MSEQTYNNAERDLATEAAVGDYDPDAAARDALKADDPFSEYDPTDDTRRALAKTEKAAEKSKRRMMRVWYTDGSVSKAVNPNKPAALIVFEAEFGHAQPETVRETMWLVWHLLGRPGPFDGAHVAATKKNEVASAFDDWFVSTEELDAFEQERGKANG